MRFTLDDVSGGAGSIAVVDTSSPWDLMGTAGNGRAKPLASSKLTVGKHSVAARITLRNGGSKTLRSTFETVAEGGSRPTVTAVPTTQGPKTTTSTKPVQPIPTVAPGSSESTAGLKNVAYWQQQYDEAFKSSDVEATRLSLSGDSWDQYGLAYEVDAAVSMFSATGDTKYLDQALKYTNNVISTAKPSKNLKASHWKDGYLGWSSFQNLDPGEQPDEFPLYESYMWRYVTNMLVAMKQNPTVMADGKYKAQYDKVLSFTTKNIFDKWYARSVDDNIYRQNAHMASHWAMISMDLSLVDTDAARVAKAKTIYTNIDNGMPNYNGGSLHKLMRKQSDGSYVFYGEFDGTPRLEDVSHGNGVMAYVVHANSLGIDWTSADMKAFSATLDRRVWPSANKYAELVDGTGSDNGWLNDGWLDLGRYDAALQKRLEGHSVARGTQFFASLALNAKLLGVK